MPQVAEELRYRGFVEPAGKAYAPWRSSSKYRMPATILEGDCLTLLPTLEANSIDAIVTDPPYHLISAKQTAYPNTTQMDSPQRRTQRGFMGKGWDGGDIAFRPDVWRECLRVLKPGGYMVAFGGCRTYHRLATAIEDAGFVIHPMLAWAFASGFPKATNASKMIDKHLGAERQVVGTKSGLPGYRAGPTGENEVYGTGLANGSAKCAITAPATPEAAQWEGWYYGLQSLKPAMESICMAQKPMIGTGAQNILTHGTGGINVDSCRVPGSKPECTNIPFGAWRELERREDRQSPSQTYDPSQGRWPPNLLLDGSEEVVECFPQMHHAGNKRAQAAAAGTSMFGIGEHEHNPNYYPGEIDHSTARFFPSLGYSDDERRVFYCAKAGKSDRAGSRHATVKPIKLMEWLCKLITPPGGTILDPFAGSGTTGQAASNLGMNSILIEREPEYIKDIERRLDGFIAKKAVETKTGA